MTSPPSTRGSKAGVGSPEELALRFAYGIDAVGRGDLDRGVSMWEACFTHDYSFQFTFFPGGPSMECPGPECPIQEFDSKARLRAEFAQAEFQRQGYLATQHQMHNIELRGGDGNEVDVFAYIQANHFLPDDVVDIFWGDFTIRAVEIDGRWFVSREEIVGTSFVKFHGSPLA